MDTDINLTVPFISSQWIGVNQKYPDEPPQEVHWAKRDAFALPPEYSHYLPASSLSVHDLLYMQLPKESSELIITSAERWFSRDTPTTDPACILERTIPPKSFLASLEKACGQAWFDGAQSVIDYRYNDGLDRLPRFVITFWNEMVRIQEKRKTWERSFTWLSKEETRLDQTAGDVEIVRNAIGYLKVIGWNTPLAQRPFVASFELAPLLGTAWLSDEHIDLMIEVISDRIKEEGVRTSIVAPLNLSVSITLRGMKKETASSKRQLDEIKSEIQSKGVTRMYFPVHVNGNHWIAAFVDFERRTYGYGDSLTGIYTQSPLKFMRSLGSWLKDTFGGQRFEAQGDSLTRGSQTDSFSCGIIAVNAIEHAIFGERLWEAQRAAPERIRWFVRIVERHERRAKEVSMEDSDLMSGNNVRTDHRDHLSQSIMIYGQYFSQNVNGHVYDVTTGSLISTSIFTSEDSDLSDGEYSPSSISSASFPDIQSGNESDDSTSRHVAKIAIADDTSARMQGPVGVGKRSRLPSSGDESSSGKESSGSSVSAPKGRSKAVVKSRRGLRKAAPMVEEEKLTRWKNKLLEDDPKVRFLPDNPRRVQHSVCASIVTMKGMYDASRWNEHITKSCPGKPKTKKQKAAKAALETHPIKSWFIPRTDASKVSPSLQPLAKKVQKKPTVPCPGVSELDHARIAIYLRRSGAMGGGARSLATLSMARFGKVFSELDNEEDRRTIVDEQEGEFKWRNDYNRQCVFSTECERMVEDRAPSRRLPCARCRKLLKDYRFMDVLRKDLPKVEHMTKGLKEIIEAPNPKTTPCIRYALGVLQGKYSTSDVFAGLLSAMVSKLDREERGVGMQNFMYAPAWDEVCHIIKINSPSAYRALSEHFPAPSQRYFRVKESRVPKFPMDICAKTFVLVSEKLKSLEYTGPVRLFCVLIPLPKAVPLVVAALPIPNDLDVPILYGYLMKVLHGLIDMLIQVVSYACDGTETERKVQRMVVEKADDRAVYVIRNPLPGAPDTTINVAIIQGQHHRQAILRARTSDPKAQASGYCHTYFDNTDVDLLSLAVFPDDHEINDAAIKASEEVNTLVALLGVERELLYRKDKSVMLPSIGAWYTGDSDIPKANIELTPGDLGDSDTLSASETDSDTDLEANELQALIEREESSTTIRSRAQENTLLSLACANFGLIADNMVQAYSTADGDEELHEELHAEEYQSIQLHSKTIAELRTSQASKPIGLGLLKVTEIHIDTLVDLRRRHETRQARLGLRTRDHRPATSPSDKEQVSARRAIIQRYHEVLRETEHAVPAGTGINRKVRTEGATITEILPTTGNAANAALAATVIQKKAANRRKEAFTKFLPKTSSLIAHLVTARLKAPDLNVSNGQPLDLGDYGIVMTAAGKLMVARIITFGSKSGGKHGRHDAISQTYNISALSRIGVQTYEHMHLRQFRSVHVSMQEWQTSTFALLGSINFLCRIAQPTTSPQWGVILSSEDTTLFKALQDSAGELAKALKWYNGRSKGETEDNDNEIDA
ncbi:hypothetical protein EYR36_009408 [Pleurotus pulmonarius]|nr:hypothetical protein EYR36_009408 [Pleurotus pulmonarius]